MRVFRRPVARLAGFRALRTTGAILFSLSLLVLNHSASAASIFTTRDLPGLESVRQLIDVSDGGSHVLAINGFGDPAVYSSGQQSTIPSLGIFDPFNALQISSDGSAVIGTTYDPDTGYRYSRGYIYRGGQLEAIDHPPGSETSLITDISADGNTVVGYMHSNNGVDYFLNENGQTTRLDNPVLYMSGDASIFAGNLGIYDRVNDRETLLHDLVDDASIRFNLQDLSADGSTAVGSSYSPSAGISAIVYRDERVANLDFGDYQLGGVVDSVSGDGSILIGRGSGGPHSGPGLAALVWLLGEDGNYGEAMSLQNYLLLLGLDVAEQGWSEFMAADISGDGTIIFGRASLDGRGEHYLIDLATTAVPLPAAAWFYLSAIAVLFFRSKM